MIQLPSPISSTTNTPIQLTCDSLYINTININADVYSGNANSPKVSMNVLPFASNSGNSIFASQDQSYFVKTNNFYAAMQKIPELGSAMQAIFAAGQAWTVYDKARKADLAQAQLNFNNAQSGYVVLQGQLSIAQSGVTKAAHDVQASGSPTTKNALAIAQSGFALAQSNLQSGIILLNTARNNITIATAALDPSNPIVIF